MSKLALQGGDDHPEAAHKHLLDAQALLSVQRADGAAYLSGYVVECALKSLWLYETGLPLGNKMPWGSQHSVTFLTAHVAASATLAGARTARYFGTTTSGLLSSPIAAWNPIMRYRPATMKLADAQAWCQIAESVFLETIAKMRLDGVL